MNSVPDLILIVAGLFALCAIIALIISGFYATAYQSKASELEKHMRRTSGGHSGDHTNSSGSL